MMKGLLLGAVAATACTLSASISCIGDDGAAVDWFIVIKKVGSSGGYAYMDNRSGGFVNSRNSMASNSSGAVARTINAAMTGSYVFFNAHSPPGGHPQPGSTYSHSAGIIGLGTDGTAMYMPHCEVFWPNAKGPYAGLKGGLGSTLMCFSLDQANMEAVAGTYLVNNAKCYRRVVADSMNVTFPILYKIVQKGYHINVAGPVVRYQRTRGGREITTFVKESRTPADIYATTIAPYYNASVYCQTWLRGNGVPRPNICATPSYPWYIRNLNYYKVAGVTQSNNWDHSKLAFIPDKGVFCLGDINRMAGVQEPGHVHCLVLPSVVKSIASSFNYNKTCDGNTTAPVARDGVFADPDPYYEPGEDTTPQPQLSPIERRVFSRQWKQRLGF